MIRDASTIADENAVVTGYQIPRSRPSISKTQDDLQRATRHESDLQSFYPLLGIRTCEAPVLFEVQRERFALAQRLITSRGVVDIQRRLLQGFAATAHI